MVATELFINMNVFIFKKKKRWKCIAKTIIEVLVGGAGAPMGATSATRPRGRAVTPVVFIENFNVGDFLLNPTAPLTAHIPRAGLGCPSAACPPSAPRGWGCLGGVQGCPGAEVAEEWDPGGMRDLAGSALNATDGSGAGGVCWDLAFCGGRRGLCWWDAGCDSLQGVPAFIQHGMCKKIYINK